ncbi:MAG: MerR family transcriptional regulator [Lachnospiraceae bacterium]|nr:MerR family transcriptional regulator [Lachnospiraceae bacterium]
MEYLLISDAAKRVQVESHVLRYWEEELKLPIKRNEAGHRYYTDTDIERFVQIKNMKERGLQLKAIKMILKDGKLDVLGTEEENTGMAIQAVEKEVIPAQEETKEEKAQRLQWLLKQLIKETLQENNQELCKDIREGVVKELDYQFRCQEERESEREKERTQRSEEYYKRMDELLRKKSGRLRREKVSAEQTNKEIVMEPQPVGDKKDKLLKGKTLMGEASKDMSEIGKGAKDKPEKRKVFGEKEKNNKITPLKPKKKRHLFS